MIFSFVLRSVSLCRDEWLTLSICPSTALSHFPVGFLWCPMDPKVPWENLIQSAQGNTECVLQLSSKVLFCVTSQLPWSLRAQGHFRHKGGWVDFGDNVTCYSLYPYSAVSRFPLRETSWFPKEISMYPARYIRIRRPELKNEMQSSPVTAYTQLWAYLLEENRSEPCPIFLLQLENIANTKHLAQDYFLRSANPQNTSVIQNEFRILFHWSKSIMKFSFSLSKKYSYNPRVVCVGRE